MTVYQDQYHMADFTYDDYEKIVITQKGPIYICAFNDAGNLNAMSYQQMAEFNDFLIKVRMDPDCRVIVLCRLQLERSRTRSARGNGTHPARFLHHANDLL